MISPARYLGLAAAWATLLIAGTLAPASAQDASCKADIVTATGRTKFRPFSKTKEMEGRGAAMADAVANWRIQVEDQFGEEWNAWTRAKDTTFDCAPTKKGKIIGSSFIACTISGRPCLRPDTSGREQAEDNRRDDRDKRADRDDRADRGERGDRGGRSRDKARRVAVVERRYKGSRAYQREMARQDWLAVQRRRAEARAYGREMARQRYLAAARERAEARVWARIDARHRYLADHRRRLERRHLPASY